MAWFVSQEASLSINCKCRYPSLLSAILSSMHLAGIVHEEKVCTCLPLPIGNKLDTQHQKLG